MLHVMHMTDVKSINWLGIIAIIGALLMIIGVFLSWMDASIDIGIWGDSESASGWDVATDDDYSEIASYTYAPLVALVCGIISLIAMIVPIVLPAKNIGKVLSLIGLILAIVTIIITALYYNDLGSFNEYGVSFGAGAGVWVVIAGAALTVIGGIIDLVIKPKRSESA